MGNGFDSISRLMAAVENPESILKQIAADGVSISQKAFEDQKFGEFDWPKIYPNQQGETVNIAGVISDFAAGMDRPQSNRFRGRPALVDKGMAGGLKGSLTFESPRMSGDTATVRWGTPLNYGQKHQDGGSSRFVITEDMKKRIKAWLFTKKGKIRRGMEDKAHKMNPFLGKKIRSYTVNIVRRPFVGITKEMGEDIKKILKKHFEDVQDGRS